MSNEQVLNSSPVPRFKSALAKTMTFGEALIEATRGRRITRLEWSSNEEYGFIDGGSLMIFTKGSPHTWSVSDGDILATDWCLLPVQN